jgi:hypothetical protein
MEQDWEGYSLNWTVSSRVCVGAPGNTGDFAGLTRHGKSELPFAAPIP